MLAISEIKVVDFKLFSFFSLFYFIFYFYFYLFLGLELGVSMILQLVTYMSHVMVTQLCVT